MMRLFRKVLGRADDRGVALPFVATMLVLLLGMTAFAVDLGWLYLNGSRIQRGADAAALAGVVHLPANTAQVNAQSVNGANANGWDVGQVNGSPTGSGGPDLLAWQPLSDNRLEVELTSTVPTFFLKVFGITELTMTRTATAEYVKPVPMGSPTACFGVGGFAAGLSGSQSLSSQGLGHCIGFEMNFWAAINGPRTAKEHGDPYAVACITANASGCTGGGPNTTDYRPIGYFYGIEVPEGVSSFDVKIFDAAFYPRPNGQTETGDLLCLTNSNCSAGPTTRYSVWAPDSTPLDPTDNLLDPGLLLCTQDFNPNHSSPNTRNVWTTICTVNNAIPGAIYVLNVRTSGTGGGNNSYSVGVSTNAGPARVYAINDMSIFTNAEEGVATVYLADVEEFHAGKTLQLGFYDPGENCGGVPGCAGAPGVDAYVTVRTPGGTVPSCNWSSHHDDGTAGPSGSGPCTVQSTEDGIPQFNAHWLNATIDIPTSYTCSTQCYWTMSLDMDESQDRTTWAARVIGNPVRLVPNEP